MHLESFSPQSKIWVYQSSRPFTMHEMDQINIQINAFVKQWTAHNHLLFADGKIVEDRFILLIVDETSSEASGCSIDKSVHFMKELEQKYQIELFNRMLTSYQKNGEIYTIPISDVKTLLASGNITSDTLFYNLLVQTKNEYLQQFIQPLSNSYLFQFV